MAKIRGKAGQKPPTINKTEVFQWLKSLPLAPEYYPTLEEFQDPIAYIYKIEKEASKYGICKIIPPVQLPSSKTTLLNLNLSLLSHSASSEGQSSPTFTTREQQVGFCPRRHRPVNKPVWQSGKSYTLPQFEEKAKVFEKNYLKKSSKKGLSSLEIETLYWKATVDKPFSVEYANDMPGSAFVPLDAKKGGREEALTVGETVWNMRGVSRSKGSLLRYMKEDIPGVTSPMIYIAMLFSWFAWHVEDHDLHSLNYMHMGAGKTWYGVPKDAAFAFEEVIRSHGYGGEINPIVTFATLAKKTTVMSPEVILNAGIPCCRLVQNAGEFVVTFPRAYHSGFSHGFNCAEASNIATPEWLRFARKAAIRRASINCPPLVSHIQLLYNLAMSLSSRVPLSIAPEPRSSRLKEKKKCAGESLVKELFMQDVMQNTDLLYNLGKGSPIITLPRDLVSVSMNMKTGIRSQSKVNSGLSFGLLSPDDKTKASSGFMVDQEQGVNQLKHSIKGSFPKLNDGNSVPLFSKSGDVCSATSQTNKTYTEGEGPGQCDELPNKGTFSCVACGILCFSCVAIIQPREVAAHNLMSADCSNFTGLDVASELGNDWWTRSDGDTNTAELETSLGRMAEKSHGYLFDSPVQCENRVQTIGSTQVYSQTKTPKDNSSLGLLALTYGDTSDSDEDQVDVPADANETNQLPMESKGLRGRSNHRMISPHVASNCSSVVNHTERSIGSSAVSIVNRSIPFSSNSDEDSSRLHVFCLQHAVEVEQKLRPIGGVHMLLLSHPDFPKLQTEAKLMADELGSDHHRSEITFREATNEDEGRIKSALTSEEVFHGNGDWAVKLGVNLFYSANLSRSPLYSKQMPYNSVLYGAFGHNSSAQTKPQFSEKVSSKQKKAVVAGKWCGKVWMSNQVHHLLAERDLDEKEQDNCFRTLAKLHCPQPSLKPEEPSKSQTIDLSSVSWSCKAGRKRKSMSNIGSTSTDKSIKVEEPVQTPDHAPPNNKFILQYKRRYKNKEKEEKEKEKEEMEKEKEMEKEMEMENPPQTQENCEQGAKQLNITTEDELEGGPSTRLRRKPTKQPIEDDDDTELVLAQLVSKKRRSNRVKYVVARSALEGQTCNKRAKETTDFKTSASHRNSKIEDGEAEYVCKMEGCTMTFVSKQELMLHEQNICPVKQCKKTFFSHKYLLQHQKVHMDARPLVCPWLGCQKTFKWAWARTEHIRVHSGDRPYTCAESGCGQTFRFVSDFSRHKRKTGHSAKKCSKKAK